MVAPQDAAEIKFKDLNRIDFKDLAKTGLFKSNSVLRPEIGQLPQFSQFLQDQVAS